MDTIIKLTDQELEDLKALQNNYFEIAVRLGQVKLEQISTKRQLQNLQDLELAIENEYITTQTKEQTFAQALQEKYGTGELNLETGEFLKITSTV